jgi:hypothetical protein
MTNHSVTIITMQYMIRTFLTILFITSTFSSTAFAIEPEPADMASISGYVVDAESKEPLIRVMVTVKDTKNGAYTNKQGFFTLRSQPCFRSIHSAKANRRK